SDASQPCARWVRLADPQAEGVLKGIPGRLAELFKGRLWGDLIVSPLVGFIEQLGRARLNGVPALRPPLSVQLHPRRLTFRTPAGRSMASRRGLHADRVAVTTLEAFRHGTAGSTASAPPPERTPQSPTATADRQRSSAEKIPSHTLH